MTSAIDPLVSPYPFLEPWCTLRVSHFTYSKIHCTEAQPLLGLCADCYTMVIVADVHTDKVPAHTCIQDLGESRDSCHALSLMEEER
jgi:hypothetical protein